MIKHDQNSYFGNSLVSHTSFMNTMDISFFLPKIGGLFQNKRQP